MIETGIDSREALRCYKLFAVQTSVFLSELGMTLRWNFTKAMIVHNLVFRLYSKLMNDLDFRYLLCPMNCYWLHDHGTIGSTGWRPIITSQMKFVQGAWKPKCDIKPCAAFDITIWLWVFRSMISSMITLWLIVVDLSGTIYILNINPARNVKMNSETWSLKGSCFEQYPNHFW